MMKREGSVRTLEIIKECAETAGGYKISLEQAERAMETEQLERIADALEGISGHLSRLTSCIGSSGAFCIAGRSRQYAEALGAEPGIYCTGGKELPGI